MHVFVKSSVKSQKNDMFLISRLHNDSKRYFTFFVWEDKFPFYQSW